jgi:hypothetical protein
MWNTVDLAYLAGVFEGDGCITTSRHTLKVKFCMTDLDVIERLREIFALKTWRDKPSLRKLTYIKAQEIRSKRYDGYLLKDLAVEYGVSTSMISQITRGKQWV